MAITQIHMHRRIQAKTSEMPGVESQKRLEKPACMPASGSRVSLDVPAYRLDANSTCTCIRLASTPGAPPRPAVRANWTAGYPRLARPEGRVRIRGIKASLKADSSSESRLASGAQCDVTLLTSPHADEMAQNGKEVARMSRRGSSAESPAGHVGQQVARSLRRQSPTPCPRRVAPCDVTPSRVSDTLSERVAAVACAP